MLTSLLSLLSVDYYNDDIDVIDIPILNKDFVLVVGMHIWYIFFLFFRWCWCSWSLDIVFGGDYAIYNIDLIFMIKVLWLASSPSSTKYPL